MTTKILFLIATFIFIIHQIIQQYFSINFTYIDSYLDDFICLPVILYLISIERKWILGYKFNYHFTKGELIIVTLVISSVFEFGLSHYSKAFTFDWYDYIAYGSGALLFYYVQKKRNS